MIFEVAQNIVAQQAIMNALFWILSIASLFPVFKGLSKTKNRYNKAFATIIVTFTIGIDLLFMAGTFYILTGAFFLIGKYPVILLVMNLLTMSFFFFMCNLYDWKKYYIIFLAIGLLQIQLGVIGTEDGQWETSVFGLLLISSMLLLVVFDSIFLIRGIKNKDGLIFTFGLFILISSFNLFVVLGEDTFQIFQIITIVSLAVLLLGTTGWVDKHIFYDREKLEKIQNNWASKMVSKSRVEVKPSGMETVFRAKRVQIICPICQIRINKKFNAEQVQERFNNPKGLVKVLISETGFCDHQFVAYIDRHFSVRGCDTIDIVD